MEPSLSGKKQVESELKSILDQCKSTCSAVQQKNSLDIVGKHLPCSAVDTPEISLLVRVWLISGLSCFQHYDMSKATELTVNLSSFP